MCKWPLPGNREQANCVGGARCALTEPAMHLTLFTDYALRTLMYLGMRPDEVVPASAISEAFDISPDHVVKAAKWLVQHGYIGSTRGKGGGLRLLRPARSVRLGDFVRASEPHLDMLECFNVQENTCALRPACRLRRVVFDAREAFFEVLNRYTLADVLENGAELAELLPAAALTNKARASAKAPLSRPLRVTQPRRAR
jgi:Rrf2 family nitric oxide-sensitive transcriptional repressor